DVDARAPDRIMEQHLSQEAFRLTRLIARVHGPIRHPRHGNVSVCRRNFEFVDAANLLVNELTQLSGAVTLSARDSANRYEQEPDRTRPRYRCLKLSQAKARRRRCGWSSIHWRSKMPVRFLLHVRVTSTVQIRIRHQRLP